MARHTDEDLDRASRVLDSLFDRDGRDEKLDEGVSIADVEADTRQFLIELSIVEDAHTEFPAARLGDELVPISFLKNGTPWGTGLLGLYPYGFYRDWLLRDRLADEPTLRPAAARRTFIRRAGEFIATRIAGVRALREDDPSGAHPALTMPQRIGHSPASVPGCHFSVHTASPGLIAHWSGAYYISPNYLGAPTTPAVGILQAGTYVFAVTGGAYGNTPQWDLNSVCTLPGTPSVSLVY